MMHINDTRAYHTDHIKTLGWELTVCNMLYPPDSPCRQIVNTQLSYGEILYEYLSHMMNMQSLKHIVEVGGGYGLLMKDFLMRCGDVSVTMADISPVMLAEQQKHVKGNVQFIQSDFLELDDRYLHNADLLICNEVIGDFMTVCRIDDEMLAGSSMTEIMECRRLIREYQLTIANNPFNFNVGALLAVEKMCKAGVKACYVSEHSCESQAADEFKGCIDVTPSYNPEEIRLFGHSEYTIRFSHLTAVAEKWGYRVHRGVYNDIFKCRMTPQLRFILNSTVNTKDEHEILRQFMGDMFTYEYMIAVR